MPDVTSASSDSQQLRCVVVTPETTVLETPARFVALPLHDGEIGILPGHSPMIGRLGYGPMRIEREGASEVYYVDGGKQPWDTHTDNNARHEKLCADSDRASAALISDLKAERYPAIGAATAATWPWK